ncbi:MAG: Transposase [Parcubacteria group bacterium Gr01-1014_31]|nr:MAG: Transposase [Parcubacteria group bacterium Gr01-1014_31]
MRTRLGGALELRDAPAPDRCLYVGIDVHKDRHTAVLTNCFGHRLLELTVGNTAEDFQTFVAAIEREATERGLTPQVALEDSTGYGFRLARYLADAGLPVKTVAPILVDRLRRHETHPEKTDSLDALGVARVLIQRMDSLPSYSVTPAEETAKALKELTLDRSFLVKEQTRMKNQLHRLLHAAYNSAYRDKFTDPFSQKALRYWRRCPVPRKATDVPGDPVLLARQIRRKIERLAYCREQIQDLEDDLRECLRASGQYLDTMSGCGPVLAVLVLAEVGDIVRFRSPSALAKYAGLSPRERSSGKTVRHRKTRAGNRRLNLALHRIALSQISPTGNPAARQYFQKKLAEGKTKVHALCCLKRRLVDIIYAMLKHRQPYRYTPTVAHGVNSNTPQGEHPTA